MNRNEENIFDWQDYLEKTKSEEAPAVLFEHVEQSIDTGLRCDMCVEVPHGDLRDGKRPHWPAIITRICGPMITLRYLGTKSDKATDLWCDLVSLRPVGWSECMGHPLTPPLSVHHFPKHLEGDGLKEELQKYTPVPDQLLATGGGLPVERIREEMVVGVRDEFDPYSVRDAKIISVVGGRLCLEYVTDDTPKPMYLFYTDFRITRPKNNNATSLPEDLFIDRAIPVKHDFKVGMLLEALSPGDVAAIRPAKVVKVLDDHYFLVQVSDDPVNKPSNDVLIHSSADTWLCTAEHPYIFPTGWARKNNITMIPLDFDWDTYLRSCDSVTTPENMFPLLTENKLRNGFKEGQKLEAVNPMCKAEVCVASVGNIVEHLLCLMFPSSLRKHYLSCDSLDLFPVGWCGTNNYNLEAPIVESPRGGSEDTDSSPSHSNSPPLPTSQPSGSTPWCPKIYFNYRCYAGTQFSKKRLSQLPISVGPGPVPLVMKEVMGAFISIAHYPTRVLRILECDGEPGPGMNLQEVKAKVRKTVHKAKIEVVTSEDQVAEYCRDICTYFQMCPYLFGPKEVGDKCPENCSTADKTKFSNQQPRKDSRLMSVLTKLPPTKASVGKRRKRKYPAWTKIRARKASDETKDDYKDQDSDNDSDNGSVQAPDTGTRPGTPASVQSTNNEAPISASPIPEDSTVDKIPRKRYRRRLAPNPPKIFEMKTRGAKLPNFALQIKQGHWDRKDMETIYSNSLRIPKRKRRVEYITESDSESELEDDATTLEEEITSTQNGVPDSTLHKSTTKGGVELETKKLPEANYEQDGIYISTDPIVTESNPLNWNIDETFKFVDNLREYKHLSYVIRKEEIDGLAFLLLNWPSLKELDYLTDSLALQLSELVVRVKIWYFDNYVDESLL